MAEDIEKLKYRINYEFKDRALLREALTHRSYAVENDLKYDNQRLEFLGDSVLGLILTHWLYHEYSSENEGTLTKIRSGLACATALADLARHLNLGDFILLGHGEIESGGAERVSTLSDLMEALIGAIYLDSDFHSAKTWLTEIYQKHFPNPQSVVNKSNPKGLLQEYTQRKWGIAPDYNIVSVQGPDHSPSYQVAASVKGQEATGKALNRKKAEIQAARNLLYKLSETDTDLSDII